MKKPVMLAVVSAVAGIAFGDASRGEDRGIGTTQPSQAPFESGRFQWRASAPLLGPDTKAAAPHVSIKDSTVVYYDSRWHLFATVRMRSDKVDIEYLSFADWPQADKAPRHVLNLHDQYYCAPQVFFFRPHKRWYLIYQLIEVDPSNVRFLFQGASDAEYRDNPYGKIPWRLGILNRVP
jgi:hypothetical protein